MRAAAISGQKWSAAAPEAGYGGSCFWGRWSVAKAAARTDRIKFRRQASISTFASGKTVEDFAIAGSPRSDPVELSS
jgi:hypothetical protein